MTGRMGTVREVGNNTGQEGWEQNGKQETVQDRKDGNSTESRKRYRKGRTGLVRYVINVTGKRGTVLEVRYGTGSKVW